VSSPLRLAFRATLRLLPTQGGGRQGAIRTDDRPSWDLGHTWLGEPSLNDGRVLLLDREALVPGEEAIVRIEPLDDVYWAGLRIPMILQMVEGTRQKGEATLLAVLSRPPFLSAQVSDFVVEGRQYYWEVFDPYVEEPPVKGSLSDDLLDVYRDVRRGLLLWDHNAPQAAIWEWRFSFGVHWGNHAIDALRALHRAYNPFR